MLHRPRSLPGFAIALLTLASASGQTPVFIVSGATQPASFGADADAVGDLDGDGIGDVAIGVPEPIPGSTPPGMVKLFSGRDGTPMGVLMGTVNKEHFGSIVAGVGDVNADGVLDIGVGSTVPDPTTLGRLRVFSGETGALLYSQQYPWLALQTLDGVGDANADGYADFAEGGFGCTGVIGTSDNGDVKLYSGATGALLHTWCGDGTGDHFGTQIAAAGDVNDDGFADIIVGASEGDDYSPEGTGYVRVLSGLDSSTLHDFQGPANDNNGFGETVDSAGDVNGDGRPDILVGARQEKVGGLFMGSATVYSGLDGSVLHHVLGTLANEQFGYRVAGPGDANGDGLADFAVATDQLDAPFPPQSGYILCSGADATPLHAVPQGVGILRAAGDLNDDALPDLLMTTGQPSAPYYATVRVLSTAPVLFEDLGFALAGSQGTPQLQIEGLLAKDLPLTLTVTDAPALAPLFLVIGGAATPVPFHGGTLVPSPQIILGGLATDAAGGLTLGTALAATPPSGLTLVLQGWLPDAAAPTHFAATNAVKGAVP